MLLSFGILFILSVKVHIKLYGSFNFEIFFFVFPYQLPLIFVATVGALIGLSYGIITGLIICLIKQMQVRTGILLTILIAQTFILHLIYGEIYDYVYFYGPPPISHEQIVRTN